MELETVQIVREDNPRGGYAIINKSDFDPNVHVLFGQPADRRAAFDAMTREELREVLDGHGVTYDARLGADKLRELALKTVFVEL